MSGYDTTDDESPRNLKTEHHGNLVTGQHTSNESRSIEGRRESNRASSSKSRNGKRGGFGTRDGSRNNGSIGHFPPSDPDPRMETEEESGNGSLRQVDENGSLHRSTYPHSSRKDSLSQPYRYSGATIPHPQQHYPTTMQQSGQSSSYTDYQPAASYATQCNDRHNGNTVDKRLDQYSRPDQVYPYAPFYELYVRALTNQAQTRDTNEYKDSTSFPQPDHYPFLGAQADLGQLSRYGRDTLSCEGPWSPQNPRIDCPPLRIELTEIENLRRPGDSDAYSSARTGSQVFSNASSDGDRWTADSSVDPSTNSTTTLRPTNRGMFPVDTFGPHPDRTASSMSESLHSGYNQISQDFEPHNRFHNPGPGFGTRPTFLANSTSHLEVPHQQQQVDSVNSSPASAPSPSPLDIVGCGVPRCRARFSGQYRTGNFARHTRQKHGGLEKVYSCEAQACRKDFKRKDARLKHYRKHHPELCFSPALPRRGHQRSELQEHDLRGISSSTTSMVCQSPGSAYMGQYSD